MPVLVFGEGAGMSGNNKDTEIVLGASNRSFGDTNTLTLRSPNFIYGLFRFELSPIPTNAILNSAVFTITEQAFLGAGNYLINRVLTNWGQTLLSAGVTANPAVLGQPSWDNAFDFNGAGDVGWAAGVGVGFGAGDFTALAEDTQAIPGVGLTANFNLLTMIQDMVTTPALNYGFMVQSNTSGNNAIHSFEAVLPANRPYLTIDYTIPSTGITRQSHTAIHNGIAIM